MISELRFKVRESRRLLWQSYSLKEALCSHIIYLSVKRNAVIRPEVYCN